MLFNSLVFLLFSLLVYAAYVAFLPRPRLQNRLLLVASYVFYGYWDWRFLSLIALSTIVDFIVGISLHRTEADRRRRYLLAASVVVNLTVLGFFKYFNFFAESLARVADLVGFELSFTTLNIVLPVGISFYTFQSLSYTIDVYRRRIPPTTNLIDFALFVAFFPQLVAGPIERAGRLLPQIARPRRIKASQFDAGVWLILWGYFKKVVIADNVAGISDAVFEGYLSSGGLDVVLGVLAFAVQIYCDFSGYSDIARGLAKLMGFDLVVNFRLPYFADSPSDFWRRWHVSLSSWLRDYLYVSLGGNRDGQLKTLRNLTLTMLLGGLWHGASWNFVLWGAYHGALLVVYRLLSSDGGDRRRSLPAALRILFMFLLTLLGWVFFRATSLEQIVTMLGSVSFAISSQTAAVAYRLVFFVVPLAAVQIWQYTTNDLLIVTKTRGWFRIPAYTFLLVWIFIFGAREPLEFLYFQF